MWSKKEYVEVKKFTYMNIFMSGTTVTLTARDQQVQKVRSWLYFGSLLLLCLTCIFLVRSFVTLKEELATSQTAVADRDKIIVQAKSLLDDYEKASQESKMREDTAQKALDASQAGLRKCLDAFNR